MRVPLISIFKRGVLANTLTACLWMAGGMVAYYSVNALFATHLQKDLHFAPGLVATPIFLLISARFLRGAAGVGGPTALAGVGRLLFRPLSLFRSHQSICSLRTSCGSRWAS